MDSRTDYERARESIITNMSVATFNHEPTPEDFVIDKLRGDPSQDGLYLCEKGCGVTIDHECDYGGWHAPEQALTVTLGAQ